MYTTWLIKLWNQICEETKIFQTRTMPEPKQNNFKNVIDRIDWCFKGGDGVREMGEGDQKVQTPNYEISPKIPYTTWRLYLTLLYDT